MARAVHAGVEGVVQGCTYVGPSSVRPVPRRRSPCARRRGAVNVWLSSLPALLCHPGTGPGAWGHMRLSSQGGTGGGSGARIHFGRGAEWTH